MSNQQTPHPSGAAIPRLAMINSFAGFGRCSTTISLPVISAMQVQVCPVPTAILSNHLAFEKCHHNDYTPHIREYINVWKDLGVTFDGLYCGFLGNEELVEIVREFVINFQPPTFLLDPVMGDNGRTYSSITHAHCESLKELAKYATLLTPNIFEACLLTDTPYCNEPWTENMLDELFEKLRQICPGDIVISGLQDENDFINYIWHGNQKATCRTPKAGAPHHGTGDLFASILVADALHGRDLLTSVKKASDFVALCIKGTESANAPEIEGVIFEKYLYQLIASTE